MSKIQPRDVIALVGFITCAVLLGFGLDGQVKAMMGFILGYYFHNAQNFIDIKKQNEPQK